MSRRAAVVVAAASVLPALLAVSSASADDPTAAELESRIVATRQQLNGLYAQAAAANERVNGATLQLQEAEAQLKRNRSVEAKASSSYDQQRSVVEAMTVEQQLNGSTSQAKLSVLQGAEPAQVLEDVTSLSAIDEAMTAQLDTLDASRTVLDSATRAVEADVRQRRDALADRKSARGQIDDAIAQAESLADQMAAERDGLVRQLARAQNTSLAEASDRIDQIDEQVDQSGPTVPGGGGGGTTQPTTPTAPAPTTQPTPKPTPTPTAPPATDPPPASSSAVEKAIAYAKAQLGEKYAWGGAGPSSWDCSGLTMRAWQSAGVSLSHYAPSQYTATKKVSVGTIKRGDLLFWSNGSASSIYHVAIYLGGGQMIHAPRPGRTVEIVPVSYWIKPDLASRPG